MSFYREEIALCTARDTSFLHVVLEIWQFWDLRPGNLRIKRTGRHDLREVSQESETRDISQGVDAFESSQ